jgi:hypothetical protein
LQISPRDSRDEQTADRAKVGGDARLSARGWSGSSGLRNPTFDRCPESDRSAIDLVRYPGVSTGRPIFAPAHSKSQGPLSDQVADVPNPRGQCRYWVDTGCSLTDQRTAALVQVSRTPESRAHRRARTTGVREAPRHEIAGREGLSFADAIYGDLRSARVCFREVGTTNALQFEELSCRGERARLGLGSVRGGGGDCKTLAQDQ